ncbi:TPA: hypothetical protein DCZ16_01855 [Candidatus Peregrinibacteria bacterium]|nr:hypothetical protein [Candidatus Peregrinibacteria bacterium]
MDKPKKVHLETYNGDEMIPEFGDDACTVKEFMVSIIEQMMSDTGSCEQAKRMIQRIVVDIDTSLVQTLLSGMGMISPALSVAQMGGMFDYAVRNFESIIVELGLQEADGVGTTQVQMRELLVRELAGIVKVTTADGTPVEITPDNVEVVVRMLIEQSVGGLELRTLMESFLADQQPSMPKRVRRSAAVGRLRLPAKRRR